MDAREFLGIERVSEDTWRLKVLERLITPGNFLFGGCGLAAGVVALEEHSGRPLVWSTAHYLSYAPTNSEVLITSTLAVEGHRVTQARATARIGDKEILTVNAALGTGSLEAEEPWVTMPEVPGPEECPQRRLPPMMGQSIFAHIDVRVAIGRPMDRIDGTPGQPRMALWSRVPGHLDPSAAMLAIFGDHVAGSFSEPLGKRVGGRSLDNTLRIAKLAPTEWVLCDIHTHALNGGFAQGLAFLWSEDGTLLATASQSAQVKIWE
jgi:acyl-CoA thioesterase